MKEKKPINLFSLILKIITIFILILLPNFLNWSDINKFFYYNDDTLSGLIAYLITSAIYIILILLFVPDWFKIYKNSKLSYFSINVILFIIYTSILTFLRIMYFFDASGFVILDL